MKKSLSIWYQAVDNLSRNDWNLSETPNLEFFKKQFRMSFKHLIINSNEIYKIANSEKLKKNVNNFTKRIADIMIKTIKEISVST